MTTHKRWTNKDLEEAVKECTSLNQVREKLGLSSSSGINFTTIRNRIQKLDLDISHWRRETLLLDGFKTCGKCKIRKEASDFFGDNAREDRLSWHCKDCKRLASRQHDLKTKFGISWEEYLKMYEDQSGLCAICLKPEEEMTKTFSVDHDHQTNKVRGLLCGECNLGLGKFKDDPNVLQAALDYLKRY